MGSKGSKTAQPASAEPTPVVPAANAVSPTSVPAAPAAEVAAPAPVAAPVAAAVAPVAAPVAAAVAPVAAPAAASVPSSSAPFKIFDCVNTVYGPGYISEIRQNDYVVYLTNWALAQGQSPTLYLAKEAMSKIPGCLPGATVKTVYGPAKVIKIRADNTHICIPINWSLANNCRPILYLQPDAVVLHQSAGFEEGDEVMTVYGQGFVFGKRDKEGDLIVKLRHWALAQGQSPTCYLHPSACVKIPGLVKGSIVKTVFGLVRINEVLRDGKHVAEAVHWKLADGKAPRLYLAPESFALLSLKP